MANRNGRQSTVTTNPLNQDLNGLINPGDIIVCTNNMLMWFDLTNDGASTTNGGGGMIRGLWELVKDKYRSIYLDYWSEYKSKLDCKVD